MNIRLLNKDDFYAYKSIRLESLQVAPEAFASSFEEESNRSDETWVFDFNRSTIFGAFLDDPLVGFVGFYVMDSLKTKHRGVLWGMYIKPAYRGQGIADGLMKSAITYAKSCVIQIHLTVITTNQVAIKFYQKHEFKLYGTEPRALKIDDQFYDQHLMLLEFQCNIINNS